MKSLAQVRKLCEPVLRIGFVKSAWVFGSWATGRQTRQSDIDILILIDDTKGLEPGYDEKLKEVTEEVRERAARRKIKLHFQQPKLLSQWWDLIREGEPWTITSIRTAVPLHDPSHYLSLIQKLLRKGELFSTEEKAQRLLERAASAMSDIREIMLDDLTYELFMVAVDCAQAVIMYAEDFPPEPKNIPRALRSAFVSKGMLTENVVDIFEEFLEMRAKVARGVLSEFTGSDLDRYSRRVAVFVSEMERVMGIMEKAEDRKNLDKTYSKCMEICKLALRKKLKRNVPRDDSAAIEKFRKQFVDTGLVDRSHYRTLVELYKYHKSRKARKPPEYVYLRGFELAMKDFVRKK